MAAGDRNGTLVSRCLAPKASLPDGQEFLAPGQTTSRPWGGGIAWGPGGWVRGWLARCLLGSSAGLRLLAVSTLLLALLGHGGAAALDTADVEVVVRVVDEQHRALPGVDVRLARVADDAADAHEVNGVFAALDLSDAAGQATLRLRPEVAGAGRYLVQAFETWEPADPPGNLVHTRHLVDVTADGSWRSDTLAVDASGALVVPMRTLNLEVVLETAEGKPGRLAFVEVEERPAGAGPGDWATTAQLVDRFGRSVTRAWPLPEAPHRAIARVDPGGDVTREFRVVAHLRDGPPIGQPFAVADDGTVAFGPGEHQHDAFQRRVTLRSWATTPQTANPAWLHHLNRARAHADLPEVEQRGDWNRAADLHARNATRNQWFAHDEDPSLPGHTLAGRWATRVGNLTTGHRACGEIDAIYGWLNSPSHAGWILDPTVRYAGYGSHVEAEPGHRRFKATLPIVAGRWQGLLVPERTRYPRDGAVFGVPAPQGERWRLTFEGNTTWSGASGPMVCTLHLFARDVFEPQQPIDVARISAQVGVADASLSTARRSLPEQEMLAPINVRTSFHPGHVALVLPAPLRPGQQVEVSVFRDGELLDAWSFTTVSLAEEPTPAPGPALEPAPGVPPEDEPPESPNDEPTVSPRTHRRVTMSRRRPSSRQDRACPCPTTSWARRMKRRSGASSRPGSRPGTAMACSVRTNR